MLAADPAEAMIAGDLCGETKNCLQKEN